MQHVHLFERMLIFDRHALCRVEALAWSPRAFVYHNFLSDEECDHIISSAKPMVGPVKTTPAALCRKWMPVYLIQHNPLHCLDRGGVSA